MARHANISALTWKCRSRDMTNSQAECILSNSFTNDCTQVQPRNGDAADKSILLDRGPFNSRGSSSAGNRQLRSGRESQPGFNVMHDLICPGGQIPSNGGCVAAELAVEYPVSPVLPD